MRCEVMRCVLSLWMLVFTGNMGSQPGHICVRCGGEIAVGVVGEGVVNIDYVFVQPGQWGRLGDLPVQLETINWLQRMGVTAIRCGTFSLFILFASRCSGSGTSCDDDVECAGRVVPSRRETTTCGRTGAGPCTTDPRSAPPGVPHSSLAGVRCSCRV
jgi:hypothetical protein